MILTQRQTDRRRKIYTATRRAEEAERTVEVLRRQMAAVQQSIWTQEAQLSGFFDKVVSPNLPYDLYIYLTGEGAGMRAGYLRVSRRTLAVAHSYYLGPVVEFQERMDAALDGGPVEEEPHHG